MANVELDETIRDKLKKDFHVNDDTLNVVLNFFNNKLKPAIKTKYLSHLVSSIENMINESQKVNFLEKLKEYKKNIKKREETDAVNYLSYAIAQNRIRLFTINLVPVQGLIQKRKAKCCVMDGGIMICYAKYLTANEIRFAIAHELGHVVNSYLLHLKTKNNKEYLASLFAYIALLDKNNFYQKECKNYISKTDIELFNNYMDFLHKNKI